MNKKYSWFVLFVFFSPLLHAAESAVFSDIIEINESGHKVKYKRVKEPSQEAIDNSQAEAGVDIDIETLKNSYISPYNYTQDPVAYNMGTSSVAGPNGTYHVGLSQINTTNINLNSQNEARFDATVEAWGQTQRWGGFCSWWCTTKWCSGRANWTAKYFWYYWDSFSYTGICRLGV